MRDPYKSCQPVWPWNFPRTNTIFGVIHQAGGYVAWSDKHPSYASVSGPSNVAGPAGSILDDYYSPEINSIPVALNVTLPIPVTSSGGQQTTSCSPLPDQTAVSSSDDYTKSFTNIQCYDTLKVNAILNQIKGQKSSGGAGRVPNLFGMNFQSVSVNQKLIHKGVSGGYTDNVGTPTTPLANAIKFVDASIGNMVSTLQSQGLYDSTLIVITAKHGQSPVDSSRYQGIGVPSGSTISNSPAGILLNYSANCLAPSASQDIGPTEDDISLLWLGSACATTQAVNLLQTTSPSSNNVAGIGQIFSGNGIAQMFNAPGYPPYTGKTPVGDSRTPDIIVSPSVGVTLLG